MPTIAHRFLDILDGVQLSSIDGDRIRKRSFSSDNLKIIENDFRLILSCSNFVGKIDVVEDIVVPTSSNQITHTHIGGGSIPRQRSSHESPTQSPSSNTPMAISISNPSGSTPSGIPNALRLKSIMCTMNGSILWAMVQELASLELIFDLVTTCDFAWDHVEMEMTRSGVALSETIHPLDLCPMSNQDISNAIKNIYFARDDLLDHLGGFFGLMMMIFCMNSWRMERGFPRGGAFEQIFLK